MDSGTNNCLYKPHLILKTNLIKKFEVKQLILIICWERDIHHVLNNILQIFNSPFTSPSSPTPWMR
jgi:hypothetical protein